GEDSNISVKTDDMASVMARNSALENRFGMALLMCDLNLDAAAAAALFFKDTSAQYGKRYIYRMAIAATGITADPGIAVVNTVDREPLVEIKDLKAQFGNHKVTLRWPTLLHKGIYSAYTIEKSLDGKKFQKLTERPYVHMSEKQQSETAFF